MRLVLDTNVLISGIFWTGAPHHILARWAKGRIEIAVTETILAEYLAVLQRFDPRGTLVAQWEQFFIHHTTIVEDQNIISISRDQSDNVFINCALVAHAAYIVSGDKDLLSLKSISPIPIITPAALLKILKN